MRSTTGRAETPEPAPATETTHRRILVGVAILGACVAAALAVGGFLLARGLGAALRPPGPPRLPASVVTVGPPDEWKRYEAERAATAERRFAELPPKTRTRIERAGYAHDSELFAVDVDGEVREDVAFRTLDAFFRGDTSVAEAAATDRLRAAFAGGEMLRWRERFGRILSHQTRLSGATYAGVDTGPAPAGHDWADAGPVVGTWECIATFEHGVDGEADVGLVYAGDGAWRVDEIVVVPYPPGPRRSFTCAGIERESCGGCGAIRWHGRDDVWHVIRGRSDHAHTWTRGAPSGPPDPVPEGAVVLLWRTSVVAGLIFRRVDVHAWGTCDYDWAWRDDGGTSLDPADPAVHTGRATGARRIDVGHVRIGWSDASDGHAWLRYAREAGEEPLTLDPRICVTPLRSFAEADAADPRWRFRGSPSDDGCPWSPPPK